MLRHRRTVRPLLVALLTGLLTGLLVVPTGLVAPAEAACARPRGSLSIGTHNTLHGTATFSRFAQVIGWQEVTDPADRHKLVGQLGPRYQHYIPAGNRAAAIPVSWKAKRFRLLAAGSVKTHDGVPDVSPSRWISVVHLRDRRTHRRVIVVNTHFISGAWKPGYSQPEVRRARWFTHLAVLRGTLAQIRAANPRAALFVVGDFNHKSYVGLRRHRIRPIAPRIGKRVPIDQVYAGRPGRGGCLTPLDALGSDHRRWRAVVRAR